MQKREYSDCFVYQLEDGRTFKVPKNVSYQGLLECLKDAQKTTEIRRYGRCPHCGSLSTRGWDERFGVRSRSDGNDECKNGHVYPASAAVFEPDPQLEECPL